MEVLPGQKAIISNIKKKKEGEITKSRKYFSMPACKVLCDSAISGFVLLGLQMLQRWMTTSCTTLKSLHQGICFGHVLVLASRWWVPHTSAGSNPCSHWTSLLQQAQSSGADTGADGSSTRTGVRIALYPNYTVLGLRQLFTWGGNPL